MIVKAYVDKSTNIHERIQSAWCVVFVCRLWLCYLQKISNFKTSANGKVIRETKKNINSYFITRPAYLSVELNAHNLLYLILLACESIFRDARSLSGTFSTKINFTVKDFLRRSQQLSILNQLKYGQLNKSISFPVHHKHKQEYSSTSSNQLDDIDTLDIEHIILAAYDQAIDVVKHSKMYYQLNQHNINNLSDLSKCIFDTLNNNSRMINYSSPASHNTADEFGLDEENDDNDDMYSTQHQSVDEGLLDYPNDPTSDDEDMLSTEKSHFNGIRLVDHINPALRQSYFKMKINGHIKYLHKQSACYRTTQ
ncbi:unnamed protein product [Rotaria socialis]|uniref:Uncharacterized protein n=1 Tax=Rotaria socialis TaxID=392032 RepID=A0A821DRG3_9BILA|nr:unnamed protein product [Rotaria socialis]CAF3466492.1 unnamed protein product [Rotaria socialis]CAF3498757.1 unnamed protein product [Rotaria socialis]CAF4503053.1 unnamed protein product [Rotaria socialis]CAF4624903.1 unnamed protein product [Rotaria socialis]